MSKPMSKQMSRIVTRALLFLLPFVWHPLSAHALELVRDGQPLAEIVVSVDADPSVRTAAAELQKYLQEMSGAELPIVDTPGHKAVPIYVGRSDFTDKLGIRLDDIRYDGFKRVVTDDYIALLGVDDCRPHIPRNNNRFGLHAQMTREWMERTGRRWAYPFGARDPRFFSQNLGFSLRDATGTLCAVYDFLEELGMRWFLPIEDLGRVVPERRNIDVPRMNVKKEPAFAAREMVLFGIKSHEFLWYKWLKQGGVFDQWPSHSSTQIVKLQPDRPELVVHRNGEPVYCAKDVLLPRLASPELRSELADYLIDLHDTIPELHYLPIGQPDGWVVLDDRDEAAGWNKSEEGDWGRFSDYTWDFVLDVANKVQAQRPGVKFCTLCYGYNRNPPKIIDRIPANIAIYFCQHSSMPGFDAYLALRNEYLRKAPESDFCIYDYSLYHAPRRGAPTPVPTIFTALMAENFNGMGDQFKGIYIELSYGQGATRLGLPGINHLMVYLHGKFTWNKHLNVKATLEDYYAKFFGPARDDMREFYEFAETVWMRPEARQITAYSGFLKPADVDQYFEILNRARAKAGDTIYGRRIDFIAEEMAPLKKLFSELQRTGPYVRVRAMHEVPVIDGDLTKPFWTEHFVGEKTALRHCITGAGVPINGTSAAFRWLPDGSLLIGVVCAEQRMDRLRASLPETVRDDAAIYEDDNIEVHLETPEGYGAVIVVNPNGSVRDTCVTPNVADVPAVWNVEQVAARKLEDRWTVEIQVKGLGNMPNKSYPWGVNVFRQRLAGGDFEGFALSPTGGGFLHAPTKMGNLYGP